MDITLMSISHDPALERHHSRVVELLGQGAHAARAAAAPEPYPCACIYPLSEDTPCHAILARTLARAACGGLESYYSKWPRCSSLAQAF
jgi:hypothetical protein